MRLVPTKDTKPEIIVRSLLHGMGLRFRLHRKNLPGSPDIVLAKHRTVIFVHGCFWHRHPDCRYASTPKTRQDFWLPKFEANVQRDAKKEAQLRELGWRVLMVWIAKLARLSNSGSDLGGTFSNLLRVSPDVLHEALSNHFT